MIILTVLDASPSKCYHAPVMREPIESFGYFAFVSPSLPLWLGAEAVPVR
jgi:hypothetical protein